MYKKQIPTTSDELLKLASSLDNLADAILKDAAVAEAQVKTAARRTATDYGNVSSSGEAPGSYDAFTSFCLN